MTIRILGVMLLLLCLSGCDRLNEIANQAKLNGRAIGAACRHSGRALEDCFQRNPRIGKADIYAGWKEMNEYMASKKIEVVAPPPDKPRKAPVAAVEIGGASEEPAATEKPADEAAKPAAQAAEKKQ